MIWFWGLPNPNHYPCWETPNTLNKCTNLTDSAAITICSHGLTCVWWTVAMLTGQKDIWRHGGTDWRWSSDPSACSADTEQDKQLDGKTNIFTLLPDHFSHAWSPQLPTGKTHTISHEHISHTHTEAVCWHRRSSLWTISSLYYGPF